MSALPSEMHRGSQEVWGGAAEDHYRGFLLASSLWLKRQDIVESVAALGGLYYNLLWPNKPLLIESALVRVSSSLVSWIEAMVPSPQIGISVCFRSSLPGEYLQYVGKPGKGADVTKVDPSTGDWDSKLGGNWVSNGLINIASEEPRSCETKGAGGRRRGAQTQCSQMQDSCAPERSRQRSDRPLNRSCTDWEY